MLDSTALHRLTPHVAPRGQVAGTLLKAIRRLAAGGLQDAQATTIFFGAFGMSYRRPLMFLRVLVEEVSRVARCQIAVAPCCCSRMTEGEAAFLLIIKTARDRPDAARAALLRMAGTLDCLPAISVAQALADALDDIGRPLRL